MASRLAYLIFDTSAINWLAKHQDRDAIVKALRLSHFVLVAETSISEIIADFDLPRREAHLDLLTQFMSSGGCIMPFNWIVEEQMKAYFHDPKFYNWTRLDVRFRKAEQEIVRREFIHTLSEETLIGMQNLRQEFDAASDSVKDAFRQAFGLKDGDPAPPFQDVAQALLARGGEHFRLGTTYIADIIGIEPDPAHEQEFMERCPPFAAMLIALTVAQYDRCMRADRDPWIGKTGRDDLLSAAYLPYCQQFVTSDVAQCNVLRFITDWTKMKTNVVLYEDFRKSLFGIEA